MPIYEYACKSCSHKLDALQKMSDDPLKDCPECGEAALKRLISAPRFRLKGKGWYETDFKTDNQRNLAKGDSESPGADSKSEQKSDKSSDKSSDQKSNQKSDKVEKKKSETSKKPASKKDSA